MLTKVSLALVVVLKILATDSYHTYVETAAAPLFPPSCEMALIESLIGFVLYSIIIYVRKQKRNEYGMYNECAAAHLSL